MRFGTAWKISLATGVLSGTGTQAFAPPRLRRASTAHLSTIGGSGWDNDDFLEALSQGPADVSDFKPPKHVPSEGEEEYQGGTRFKQLKEIAEQAKKQGAPPVSRGAPIMYNPANDPDIAPLIAPTVAPATPPAADPDSLESMSEQEQARMFRLMMQQQQQQPQSLPKQRRGDPDRKVGRNKDADTIANTADLYFAQLKRDSTVRTIARHQGDVEKANKVFKDEGIEKLKDAIKKNPYFTGDENNTFLDTSTDEMIAVMKLSAGKEEEIAKKRGVSYKDKLKQRQQKAKGAASAAEKPAEEKTSPVVSEVAPAPAPAPKVVAKQAAPEVKVQSVPETPPAATVAEPKPAIAASPSADPEETRRSIRTLMGLILKHRGGPGFGAGRLKGPEAEQLEEKLSEITAMLRSEATEGQASGGVASPESKVAVPPPVSQSVASPTPAQVTQQPTTTAPPPPAGTTVTDSVPTEQRILSMLACVDGAVQMYKHSPPELQEGALVTLRSALMSAVNTCSEVMQQPDTIPPVGTTSASTAPAEQRLSGMVACVEGAVQMYKHSPPELQESSLGTLRGALMSAVNTCNQVIAENEVKSVQNYQATVPAPPAAESKPAPKGSFYEVKPYEAKQEEGESVATPKQAAAIPEPQQQQANTGTDENSQFLQGLNELLAASSGDEKFGLSNLSQEDAAALADNVREMKAMLMDELDSGIPDPKESTTTQVKSQEATSAGSATSGYQQMLAKKKAEKNA